MNIFVKVILTICCDWQDTISQDVGNDYSDDDDEDSKGVRDAKISQIFMIFFFKSEVLTPGLFTPSSNEIFLQLYQARRVLCSMDTHTRTCTELHAKVKKDLAVAQRSRSAPRTTQALEGLPEETFARQVLVGQNAGRGVRG